MKKIGLLFATIIMMLLFAFSASAATEGYYTYEIENGEATITDVDEAISSGITIPSTLGGYSVTTIGDYAFSYCNNLISITIPNSVTTIGDYAFGYCSNLTSITIPNGVSTIGDWAFVICDNLTSVAISSSVTTIGYKAFYSCDNLSMITVDSNNKYYSSDEYGVLFDKNKTVLIKYPEGNTCAVYTLPDTVTTIRDQALDSCDNLTSITVGSNNKYYSNDEYGVLFNKNKTELIQYPIGNTRTAYIIPDSVTTIGEHAFEFCGNLTSVTIPDSVTKIRYDAFEFCDNLISATIGNSVTQIEHNAFRCCRSLKSVTIPDSVTTIGDEAFDSCNNLMMITVGSNNKYYSSDEYGVLFNKNKTELIKYPDGNTRTAYIIPDGVTTIREHAFFSGENLTSVTITDSVTTIESAAFFGCYKLDDVYFVGSQSQWNKIAIDLNNNGFLLMSRIHFSSNFLNHPYLQIITLPTCTEKGYTSYVCNCGYVDKVEDYVQPKGHDYSSLITKQPTHKEEGVKTFTCECGDTYTESIAIIPHSYSSVVTAPTCTEQGYTTYTCECGHVYTENIAKTPHSYASQITKQPTHKEEGIKTFTCECGDSYTDPVAKIPHSYSKTVTAPTCTSKGYTTFTCECGDSYVGDYVGTKAHSYSAVVTRPATHLATGIRTYTCKDCGNSYTESIAKTTQHTHIATNVVSPECEKEGYTVYVCECGDSYHGDIRPASGHNYNGDNCSVCGESKVENCGCNCHKGGFSGFIWKILRFFYKLFGMNKTCSCGVAHY